MKILSSLSLEEMGELLKDQPKFRARQVYDGVYHGKAISEISNLPKALKERLLEEFVDQPIKLFKRLESSDGTQKFVYELCDGNLIEGVLMKYKYGYTLCVSTQVGCRMGCKFCASGLDGLVRNLESGEILSQVLVINALLGGTIKDRKITNVVLMGSGEPFDNYDNVVKFLRLVSSADGINISPRNISISTCGLVDKIEKFAGENLDVTLTISLHAPNDEIRKSIMPIASRYSYSELIEATRKYALKTRRRVVFEYALIKGLNDSLSQADELASQLKGFPLHVNLIPLNPVKERGLDGSSKKHAYAFMARLEKCGVSATVRRTMGEDIEGACGQLRNKILKENED